MSDSERLDWIGEPGFTKSRMDNVISQMRQYDIRGAVDAARELEKAERDRVREILTLKGGLK